MNLELEMLQFINLARQYPSYFVSVIDEQYRNFINDHDIAISNDIIYQTQQGKMLWLETRDFLINQKPIKPLYHHHGLEKAANDHVIDMCQNQIFGHRGSDNSIFSQRILRYCKKGVGSMSEIIGADFCLEGRNHAQLTILGLIIDDGVNDRGHRKTIFNPDYRYIGIKSGIQQDKIITVFNLTQTKLQQYPQQPSLKFYNNAESKTYENFQTLKSNSSFNNLSRCYSKPYIIGNNNNIPKGKSYLTNTIKKNYHQINQTNQNYLIETNQSRKAQDTKILAEKIENVKNTYQEGHKVTETVTKFIYTDGTVEESISKHTFYI